MGTPIQPSVLWREGLFLCPQHLQAQAREVHARIRASEKIGHAGTWGALRVELDAECLKRDVLRLDRAEILFPDGTLAAFPENAEVPQREFADEFREAELDVFLGIEAAQAGVAQLAEAPGSRGRYRAEVLEVFDENVREAPRDLETRILQARFFFGHEDRGGFECLQVARLVRRGKPVAESVLSDDWIPPILAVGASPVLSRNLRELADQVRAQARDLAARLPSATGLSSVERGTDLAGFIKLQAVNQCVAPLEQLASLPDLHPLQAYLALAQAVGNLAIFGDQRVTPELPAYDHGDLDGCFHRMMEAVRSLIPAEVSVPYDTVAVPKHPTQEGFYLGEIPAEWLDRNPTLYLGVDLAKPGEEVATLVPSSVKLLAEQDLDRVLQGVMPGIGLEYARSAPLSFPKRPNLHFFRIETEGSSRDGWLKVQEAGKAVLLTALGGVGAEFHFYVELKG